ncbi:RNA polymerase II transcription factor B subunit 2 [Ceratobasidium theobromae]|uniref:RNA polymerase II transcription factor B subunit 2 n=1 Tax=Ceratobasidium theobromae TaxID=1582974 RepID=A0A5N5QGR0_9AGAM|nr:RNA polymerase II transcription factor B subunit 2 [Ceratobasidium theobromae]
MPSAPSDPLPPRPDAETEHALLPFLKQQPPQTLNRLYSKPSACLAVFRIEVWNLIFILFFARLLRQLDRQLVLNLLWCDVGVALHGLMGWAKPEAVSAMQTSVSDLKALSILRVSASNPPSVILTTAYRDSLRVALRGGGDHKSFGMPVPSRGQPQMSIEQLDKKAIEHWEVSAQLAGSRAIFILSRQTILHYMVDTNSSAQRPGGGALHLLVAGGWLEEGRGGGGHEITSTGFQFLLQSPRAQLWDILLQYLHMSDSGPEDGHRRSTKFSIHALIDEVGTVQEYSCDNLSLTQNAMMTDLKDYGIVYVPYNSNKSFYPTRLATTLSSSLPPLPSSISSTGNNPADRGFIILETNYRLYAYTDNPLQTSVLNLFVSLRSRFPNLVVGHITRDSVKRALSKGISAEQIISYLETHAHPQMRRQNPLLPVTVQDQIRLWEMEQNRVQEAEGYLYTEFGSQADYELVLKYAKECNLVLYESARDRQFFAKADGHALIRQYIERRGG